LSIPNTQYRILNTQFYYPSLLPLRGTNGIYIPARPIGQQIDIGGIFPFAIATAIVPIGPVVQMERPLIAGQYLGIGLASEIGSYFRQVLSVVIVNFPIDRVHRKFPQPPGRFLTIYIFSAGKCKEIVP